MVRILSFLFIISVIILNSSPKVNASSHDSEMLLIKSELYKLQDHEIIQDTVSTKKAAPVANLQEKRKKTIEKIDSTEEIKLLNLEGTYFRAKQKKR